MAGYLERSQLSQAELARKAKVSQSTVSRARSTPVARHGRARAQLFRYIQKQTGLELHQAVKEAVAATWDGSDEHAKALAGLISASRELWPKLARRERDDGE